MIQIAGKAPNHSIDSEYPSSPSYAHHSQRYAAWMLFTLTSVH